LTETKIEEYLKQKLQFQEIKLTDYFINSINFNFDIFYNKLDGI